MSEEVSTNTPGENKEEKTNPHQEIILPEEVEELLEGLPEPQQKAVRAVLVGVSYQQSMWRGPLPPPDMLKQYNEAFENGAERIFMESQKQTDHRIAMESRVIPEEQRQSRHGQYFGFAITIAFLIVSGFLIYTGHDVAGTTLGTIDLIALVTVFITGRKSQRKQLDDDD